MTTHTRYSSLLSIGFDAAGKGFDSYEEAFEYRKKYPEFFVLPELLEKRGDKIVLVKTVTTEEEVSEEDAEMQTIEAQIGDIFKDAYGQRMSLDQKEWWLLASKEEKKEFWNRCIADFAKQSPGFEYELDMQNEQAIESLSR